MTLTWFECSTSTIRQILDICKEYKEFELQNLTSCEKTQPPKTPSQKGNDIKGQGNNSKDNNKIIVAIGNISYVQSTLTHLVYTTLQSLIKGK